MNGIRYQSMKRIPACWMLSICISIQKYLEAMTSISGSNCIIWCAGIASYWAGTRSTTAISDIYIDIDIDGQLYEREIYFSTTAVHGPLTVKRMTERITAVLRQERRTVISYSFKQWNDQKKGYVLEDHKAYADFHDGRVNFYDLQFRSSRLRYTTIDFARLGELPDTTTIDANGIRIKHLSVLCYKPVTPERKREIQVSLRRCQRRFERT